MGLVMKDVAARLQQSAAARDVEMVAEGIVMNLDGGDGAERIATEESEASYSIERNGVAIGKG